MMKKILALLMALSLMLAFTACSDKDMEDAMTDKLEEMTEKNIKDLEKLLD